MKPLKFGLLVVVMALLAGCASTRLARPEPPTLDEIVAMSKAGTPADEIIKKLRESRAYYPLTASEIANLHDRGVPDPVLDYIHQVYLREVREDEASRSYYRNDWYLRPYFFFGHYGHYGHGHGHHGHGGRWRGGLQFGW
ncbi:MAG: hypothetical protein ABIW48_03355 [Burkholderiales bacterium]|nr:hypothetical protein [Pseudomonadota bacterium]